MRTTHNASGESRDGHAARTGATPGSRGPGGKARRVAAWGRAKYAGSWAENLWQRLDTVDFLNQAIQLAATLLLCAVPFMLIASALAGRSAVSALSLRLGLSSEAASDVGQLFASSAATSAAVTGVSWVFFVVGGLAVAASIQQLYLRVFQLRGQAWDRLRALVWLAVLVGWVAAGTAVGHAFRESLPVFWWILNTAGFIGFWWFTMWFLLAGRVGWRRLLPSAVATSLFWIGMLVVFHFTFSGMVVGNNAEYGPIGVVFSLMSFFIAIGVVIILGATTGMMWHDRDMSWRAALTRTRRAP